MSTETRKSDPKFVRAYDRAMLRSAFVSLFWAVITERRKKGTYTLIQLAKQLGANKAEVSRWFRGQPNWTIGTIANIANALNVDLHVQATDRVSGEVFTPAGIKNRATLLNQRVPEGVTSASRPASPVRVIQAPEGTNPIIGADVQSAALNFSSSF